MVNLSSLPAVVAFDAEMVIALKGKLGTAISRLKKSLSQSYTRRHSAAIHFLDSD